MISVTIEIEENDLISLIRYINCRKLLWDINYTTPSVAERIAVKICDAAGIKNDMEHNSE